MVLRPNFLVHLIPNLRLRNRLGIFLQDLEIHDLGITILDGLPQAIVFCGQLDIFPENLLIALDLLFPELRVERGFVLDPLVYEPVLVLMLEFESLLLGFSEGLFEA